MTNHFAVVSSEKVDKQGAMEESIMLAMRTVKGLNLAKFEKEFSCSFRTEYASALEKNAEYLEEEDGYLRIKPEFLYVQNSIICDFFKEWCC